MLDPAKLLYLRFYISGDFNFSIDNVELYSGFSYRAARC